MVRTKPEDGFFAALRMTVQSGTVAGNAVPVAQVTPQLQRKSLLQLFR
jgi:hypothetical protein